MAEQNSDFYQNLRKEINKWLETKVGKEHKWAEYLLLAPDLFHLLIKLSLDKDVPMESKAKLAIAIAYFISPIDLIPEGLIGPAGYVDDIALSAYVINHIVNNTNPEIVKRHWSGEEDVLKVIKDILKQADETIGSGLWAKIKNLF